MRVGLAGFYLASVFVFSGCWGVSIRGGVDPLVKDLLGEDFLAPAVVNPPGPFIRDAVFVPFPLEDVEPGDQLELPFSEGGDGGFSVGFVGEDGDGTVVVGGRGNNGDDVIITENDGVHRGWLRKDDLRTYFDIRETTDFVSFFHRLRASREMTCQRFAETQTPVEFSPSSNRTIRVLFLWSKAAQRASAAASESRGAGAMRANINLAVTEANRTLDESGVRGKLEIAGSLRLRGFEENTIGRDLKALTDPDNGFFDEVHRFRDQRRADLVVVIGKWADTEPCGSAWQVSPWAESADEKAFSALQFRCLDPGRSALIHEIAHNLGADHDRRNSAHQDGEAFGFRTENYGTVMNIEVGVFRLPFFSSPRKEFNREVLGRDRPARLAADNVEYLNAAIPWAANYR